MATQSSDGGALLRFGVIALIVAAIAGYLCLFIVGEREQKLVIRFGKVQSVVTEPGLHFKLPIDDVISLEDRLLTLDVRTTEADDVLTQDQRRVVVDAFVQWRITRPAPGEEVATENHPAVRFYEAFNNEAFAQERLRRAMENAMRTVLGRNNFDALLTDERVQLMGEIASQVQADVDGEGVTIVDVRIRRADLPQQNLAATFQRMISERQQEAVRLRSDGEAEKRAAIAQARSQAETIKAEGRITALTTRGRADAAAYQLVMEAIGGDVEFHALYRSLLAYRASMTAEDGSNASVPTLVLSPDSDFFAYFQDSRGGQAPAAPAPVAPAPVPEPAPVTPTAAAPSVEETPASETVVEEPDPSPEPAAAPSVEETPASETAVEEPDPSPEPAAAPSVEETPASETVVEEPDPSPEPTAAPSVEETPASETAVEEPDPSPEPAAASVDAEAAAESTTEDEAAVSDEETSP